MKTMKSLYAVVLCVLLTGVCHAQSALVEEADGQVMRLVGTAELSTATAQAQRAAALEVLRSFRAANQEIVAVELLDPITNNLIVRVTLQDLQ
jgi:hypothetical protein